MAEKITLYFCYISVGFIRNTVIGCKSLILFIRDFATYIRGLALSYFMHIL
jgi:hypothetical protein